MGLGDIWDYLADGWDYVISFEWWDDFKDFLSEFFENIGEFSIIGLVHAVVFGGLTFMTLRKLEFIKANPHFYFILIPVVMIIGYFIGKHVWREY